MRVVSEIPHSRYKITIHQYNGKYMVKIELGTFEQIYKIDESSVGGVQDVEKMVTETLLSNALKRFIEMRADWEASFNQL